VKINKLRTILFGCVIIIPLLFGGIAAAADEESALPDPDTTPDSPLYYLERAMETVQEMFTFGEEAKAQLNARFASERIAEIEAMLEADDVEAAGLEVAQVRLQTHLGKAAGLINSGQDGNDEADANTQHEAAMKALEEAKEAKKEYLNKKKELQEQLKVAVKKGWGTAQYRIRQEMEALEADKDAIKEMKEQAVAQLKNWREAVLAGLDIEDDDIDYVDVDSDVDEDIGDVGEDIEDNEGEDVEEDIDEEDETYIEEEDIDNGALVRNILNEFHAQREAAKDAFKQVQDDYQSQKMQLQEQLRVANKNRWGAAQYRIRQALAVLETEKDEAEALKDQQMDRLEAWKDNMLAGLGIEEGDIDYEDVDVYEDIDDVGQDGDEDNVGGNGNGNGNGQGKE